MTTPDLAHVMIIPDSLLAKEATDILREHSTDLLFNYYMRVYLFATEQRRQRKLTFDPELQAELARMPPHKFIQKMHNGSLEFIYVNPTICDCLYVGNQAPTTILARTPSSRRTSSQ